MKLKAAVVVAVTLLALGAVEAKAQSVTITNVNTTVSKQITVTVSITNGTGWNNPSGCAVQLRPPKGAGGPGLSGSARDVSAKMDGSSWAITYSGLTGGTNYDVQAIGHLTDNVGKPHTYYSGTSNATVKP